MMSKGAKIGEQRIQENISELQLMIQEEAKKIQVLQQDAEYSSLGFNDNVKPKP